MMIEKLFGDMLESENDFCALGRDIITGNGPHEAGLLRNSAVFAKC